MEDVSDQSVINASEITTIDHRMIVQVMRVLYDIFCDADLVGSASVLTLAISEFYEESKECHIPLCVILDKEAAKVIRKIFE